MIYKRIASTFTFDRLLWQIVEYVKENQEMPEMICLPPDEFVYMSYLMPTDTDCFRTGCKQFIGIPLEINYDKQEVPFGV